MPSTEARLGESLLCGTSHLHLLQSVGQVNDVGFGDVSLAWTVLTGDVFHMDEDDWLPVVTREEQPHMEPLVSPLYVSNKPKVKARHGMPGSSSLPSKKTRAGTADIANTGWKGGTPRKLRPGTGRALHCDVAVVKQYDWPIFCLAFGLCGGLPERNEVIYIEHTSDWQSCFYRSKQWRIINHVCVCLRQDAQQPRMGVSISLFLFVIL